MKKIILVLLFVILIFIIGCTDKISETAKESKKEIIFIGRQGAELVISPSTDQEIKGTITITMEGVPQRTKYVAFYIESGNSADARDGPPNLGFDDTENDGWTLEVDTTAYDNGQQQIFALAFADEPSAGSEPLAAIQSLATINNPPVTYSRNYPAVEELKELGINTVSIVLNRHLKNSEEVALKWAKIAEEYQAEYFAPQNEFNGPIRGNFAEKGAEEARITSEWHQEMLPGARITSLLPGSCPEWKSREGRQKWL